MVARRSSSSDSAAALTEEALRKALAESEATVDKLSGRIAELTDTATQFLSEAAHSIGNPLTVIHSYLEVLTTDLQNGLTDEQRSYLGVALENAVKLRRLVDDLADMAALETGSARVDLAPVHIRELLASVQSELRPRVEECGLDLTAEIAENLTDVTADEMRLKDVLRRLLDNAVRFNREGGSITVRARSDKDSVVIDICDTGVCIPADRIAEALRVFGQIHRRPGENREGYGLGLPLSRRQMEAMGGSLELASAVGEGTTVTIRIPVFRE